MSTQTQKKKKYRYTPIWVRITTLSLFLGFLILGIVTIIYVQGNVIDIRQRQIISTGSIRIESNVSDYIVYLNEEKVTVLDNQINGVAPGEYAIRVEKEGYNPFETIVKVNEGLITFVGIQLFRTDAQYTNVFENQISEVIFNQPQSTALYITNQIPDIHQIRVRSFNNSLLSIVSSNDRSIVENNKQILDLLALNIDSLIFSPSGDRALLQEKATLLWYVIPINKSIPMDAIPDDYQLDILFEIDAIDWLSNDDLVIQSGNTLYSFNVETKEYTLITISSTSEPIAYSIDTVDHAVYFLKAGELYKFTNKKIELFKPVVTEPLYGKGVTFTSIYFAKDNIIITKGPKKLYIFHENFETYTTVDLIDILSISPTGHILLGKDGENIVSIQITEQSVSQLLEIVTNTFNSTITKKIDIDSINWASDGSFFIYQAIDDDQKLYSSDPKGNQSTVVFQSVPIEHIGRKLFVSNDKESILIPITTSDNETSSLSVIRLEIK